MSSSVDHKRITQVKDTVGQMRLLHAELLEQVAILEREQIAQHVGYPSTARLLVDALHLNPGQAAKLVLHSGLVTETLTPTGHTTPAPLPHVRSALREGVLDPAHLDAIVATVKQLPDWVDLETRELVEQVLADTARAEAPCVVRRQGEILLDRIDQDGANPNADKQQAEPRNLFRSRRIPGGGMKCTAILEPETAELLGNHVRQRRQATLPGTRYPRPSVHSGAAWRCLVRDHPPGRQPQRRPARAAHRHHGHQRPAPRHRHRHPQQWLRPLPRRRPPASLHRRSHPVVFKSHSVPTDLGRTRRLVTPRQRALLLARDRGCAYPGCCAPARWAEAHHIKHVRHEACDFRAEVGDLRR